ncbi:TIGR03083 family protein [Lentzea xinjiangensis]|uniref:TIGR03083 family protein n=1 Tax=Lentzea xinjiangensis TaxID=402600 RepID=A0A1H9F9M9_9PSEU|nr:maleylpyruvate isomerase family mycothiol-dependent enzyme [Lentzea xinjiangensis]SEQ34666.1 TIGR03083 family protein [Lentzea xinjiangensis]
MGSLSYSERAATIVTETSLLVSALHGADLSVRVPSAPDWTLNQLLRHLGHAHRWVAEMIHRRVPETDRSFSKAHSVSEYAGETAEELGPWLTEGAALLSDALLSVDVDDPIAVMVGMPGPRFWSRRMAHETVVHRFDAMDALGLPFEVDEEIADDTLHEWMTTLLPFIFGTRPGTAGLLGTGALYFEAPSAQWTVDLTGSAPRVARGEEKWDVAARGSAFDLVLAVYQRRGTEGLEVRGDAGLLAEFLAAMRF